MYSQAQAMDRMYRYQRHIYDATRKYYLLGRDRLIRGLSVQPGQCVIEIGCGTGRNLVCAARLYPQGRFFGVDASEAMLQSARQKWAKRTGMPGLILHQGLAETLDYRAFGLTQGFDKAFFSYTLSMIPAWQPAVDASLRNLKPGGELWVVDFADQRRLPRWFAQVLQGWLARFGVVHDPALLTYLRQLQDRGVGQLRLESLGRDYAFLACFRKR